jgi:hypothetical protein
MDTFHCKGIAVVLAFSRNLGMTDLIIAALVSGLIYYRLPSVMRSLAERITRGGKGGPPSAFT